MHRPLRRFALSTFSVTTGIIALGIGFAVSSGLYFLDGYMQARGFSAERFLWSLIRWMGWYWWSIPIISSMIGLYYLAQLDRPRSRFGFVARMLALTAFVLYLGSWANTALGPIAAICAIVSYAMLIRQLAMACAARRERPSYKNEPFLTRLYASLTTELDDVKRNGI